MTTWKSTGDTTPAGARLASEMHQSVLELIRYREQRPNDYGTRLGMVCDYLVHLATEEGSRTGADTREGISEGDMPTEHKDPSPIQGLRELLEKATPGPWEARTFLVMGGDGMRDRICHVGTSTSLGPPRSHESAANAALFAAMRNALPSLLDRAEQAERLEGELANARRILDIHVKVIADKTDRLQAAEARSAEMAKALSKLAEVVRGAWYNFTQADPIELERHMEDAGLAELRPADRDDLEAPFASELGIVAGGSVWDLTSAGRDLLVQPEEKAG